MTEKKEAGKIKRRDFIKKVGVGAAAVAATAVNAPFVHAPRNPPSSGECRRMPARPWLPMSPNHSLMRSIRLLMVK